MTAGECPFKAFDSDAGNLVPIETKFTMNKNDLAFRGAVIEMVQRKVERNALTMLARIIELHCHKKR